MGNPVDKNVDKIVDKSYPQAVDKSVDKPVDKLWIKITVDMWIYGASIYAPLEDVTKRAIKSLRHNMQGTLKTSI